MKTNKKKFNMRAADYMGVVLFVVVTLIVHVHFYQKMRCQQIETIADHSFSIAEGVVNNRIRNIDNLLLKESTFIFSRMVGSELRGKDFGIELNEIANSSLSIIKVVNIYDSQLNKLYEYSHEEIISNGKPCSADEMFTKDKKAESGMKGIVVNHVGKLFYRYVKYFESYGRFIEFYISTEDLSGSILEVNGLDHMLFLKKENIDRLSFLSLSPKQNSTVSNWLDYKRFIIAFSTDFPEMGQISDLIEQWMSQKTAPREIHTAKNSYSVRIRPIVDYSGNEIGGFLFLMNKTDIEKTATPIFVLMTMTFITMVYCVCLFVGDLMKRRRK